MKNKTKNNCHLTNTQAQLQTEGPVIGYVTKRFAAEQRNLRRRWSAFSSSKFIPEARFSEGQTGPVPGVSVEIRSQPVYPSGTYEISWRSLSK